jgi:anti-anti-sigma regulatory factor
VDVVVDLSAAEHINSVVLRAIVVAHKTVLPPQRLILRGAHGEVARVLEVTGLGSRLGMDLQGARR